MTVQAVTFDFWNTLVNGEPSKRDDRIDAWARLLEDGGFSIEMSALETAVGVGWQAYVRHWTSNTPFGAAEVVAVMVDELGITGEPALLQAMLDVVVDPPAHKYPPLNTNLLVTLEALRSAGIRIGIVCDVGLTPSVILRRHLSAQGALEFFDHASFSDEVGVYKPDAKIFHHALDGLGGIAPQSCAHIGDLRRTDIVGAKSMGMTAVRYTGVHDDPNPPDAPVIEGDHVIADMGELPGVLGLA